MPACEKLGVGILPFFPLANGLLTGKYRRGQDRPAGTRMEGRDISERTWERIEKLAGFAEERGHTLLELAFGGLLTSPAVSSVIAGATTPEQVKANAAARGVGADGGGPGDPQGALTPGATSCRCRTW